jgi:hypothetical protein
MTPSLFIYRKIKMIDFKNKRIVQTGYRFTFAPLSRSEDWTIEDELMALSIQIQTELIQKDTGNQAGIYEWFEHIERLALQTTNKSYDCTGTIKSESDYPIPKHEVIKERFSSIDVKGLNYMGNIILSAKGEESVEEEKKQAKAVAIAKKQYAEEQEQLIREQEELEELKQAEVSEVVIPLKNYGK